MDFDKFTLINNFPHYFLLALKGEINAVNMLSQASENNFAISSIRRIFSI